MINDREARLVSNGIRPTPVRVMLLDILENAPGPMSATDIEIALDTVDRSTITRTVSLFAESGLLHVFEDGSGVPKYEYCRSDHGHSPDDGHPHFHCRECGRTFCLDNVNIPAVSAPDGFQIEDTSYLMTGLCRRCAGKK